MADRKGLDVGETLGAALHSLADAIDSIMDKGDVKIVRAKVLEARTAADDAALALGDATDDPVTKERILGIFPHLREQSGMPQDFGKCRHPTGRKKDGSMATCGKPSVYDGFRCEEHRP